MITSEVEHNHQHQEIAAIEAGKHSKVRAGSEQYRKLLSKWADVRMPMASFVQALHGRPVRGSMNGPLRSSGRWNSGRAGG